jgi:hypothetical protein
MTRPYLVVVGRKGNSMGGKSKAAGIHLDAGEMRDLEWENSGDC